MRVFVAAEVDARTRRLVEDLRHELTAAVPTAGRALRWVSTEHLHVTVRFLGDRDDIDTLKGVLRAPLATVRFDVAWAPPSWMPPSGRARVLCVSPATGISPFEQLAREVSSCLESIGIEPEARPFRPHLTVARVRDGVDAGLLALLRRSATEVKATMSCSMPVDHVVLIESRLSSAGPTYTVRHRVRLS